MSEVLKLWSVTSINSLALGKSYGIVKYGKQKIAGISYDKIKMLQGFVEDGDRDGWIDYALNQEWAGLKQASARGTDLHRAAEQIALGQEPQIEEHNRPYLDQMIRFVEDFRSLEYVMAEAPVYNLRYRYAGTCDGIIKIDGQTVLFDIKTTAHAKNSGKSRPPFEEALLQIAAYRHAELVGLLAERVETNRGRYYSFDPTKHTEPMPATDGAVCLVISPFDYELIPVRANEEVFNAFLHVLGIAKFKEEIAKVAVGPAITPPKAVAA